MGRELYVETLVRAPLDRIWAATQDPTQHQQAWAAAFVLIMFVLVTSLTARYLLHRSVRKLRGGPAGERALTRVMAVFARAPRV